MSALIVVLLIIAVVALILLIPVRIKIYCVYKNRKTESEFSIKYGFISVKKSKSEKKTKRKKEATKKEKPQKARKTKKASVMSVIRFVKSNTDDIKKFINSVTGYLTKHVIVIDKLRLNAVLGTDDAMETALVYGASSGFMYNILGIVDRNIKISEINIDYHPDFNVPQINIEFESIIRIKIYNSIILAFIALIRGIPIYKKRGDMNNGKSD